MQRVKGHFTGPSPVPVAATTQQQPSIYPGAQAHAPADAAASSASVQASTQSVIPTCQAFLDGLMAGTDGGEQDKLVLEAIAGAVLLRVERLEIHLKHKNRRVRAYARQLFPRKALVRKSQRNKRRAAALRLHAKARQVGGHSSAGTDAALAPSRAPLCGRAGGSGGGAADEPRRF